MKSLTIQQAAEKSIAVNTKWTTQGTYTGGGDVPNPPAGGRRWSVVFPTLPTPGDTVTIEINGSPVTVTYADLEGIAAALRAVSGVQSCSVVASATYTKDDGTTVTGDAVEIIFEAGDAAAVTFTTDEAGAITGVPDGAAIVDTSEGVSVAGALEATIAFDYTPAAASLTVGGDIVYTAGPAFPGTQGHNIGVRYVVSGNNTPLSVVVDQNPTQADRRITVNLETDGGGAAVSTANEVALAVNQSKAARECVSAAVVLGQGADVQTAHAVASLAGGGTLVLSASAYALMDDSSGDGSGNRWASFTPAGFSGLTIQGPYPFALPVPCSRWQRIYIQPTALTGSGSLTIRIGACEGV